jgi:hypothetical protein
VPERRGDHPLSARRGGADWAGTDQDATDWAGADWAGTDQNGTGQDATDWAGTGQDGTGRERR